MTQSRFAKGWGIAAGLLFLSVAPGLTGAQSTPPAPTPSPQMTPPPKPQKLEAMDDFAGLKYTDDQQAKIRQIHQDFKARMDLVIKEKKLSAEQKGAMIQGYQHMERGAVYKVLNADQQKEVRRRVLARREAAEKEREKSKPSPAQ